MINIIIQYFLFTWVKGGALCGPSMATTREFEAVSRPARNTPARKMAAMVNMVTSGHAGHRVSN